MVALASLQAESGHIVPQLVPVPPPKGPEPSAPEADAVAIDVIERREHRCFTYGTIVPLQATISKMI